VDLEAEPEVESEAEAEVESEAEPEVESEAEPEVESEVEPEVESEAEPEAETEWINMPQQQAFKQLQSLHQNNQQIRNQSIMKLKQKTA
jgi:pilus assembly protein FimV